MRKPDISIIIVNYNTSELLDRCLSSIREQKEVNSQVIVVDNCSSDSSVSMVRNNHTQTTLITNDTNAGFSKANNQGLKIAEADLVFYLNPDTEIHEGCLEKVISFMKSHPAVGMAGTRIVFPDGSQQGSIQYRYPGHRPGRRDIGKLPGDICWLLGASLIGRKEILEKIGGFDERFFLYGEDADLGLEIRKAGWELGYIDNAVITHWEGQSEKGSKTVDVLTKKFTAEFVFYEKHYSPQTIKTIKRKNHLQALWRIFSLTLSIPFLGDKATAKQKLERYQLAREVYSSKGRPH